MKMARGWMAALILAVASTAMLPPSQIVAEDLPYSFFFTRYQLARSASQEESVRYHSDGQPFAKAPDGSTIVISGQGGWDPSTRRADGGGRYVIKDGAGLVTAEGAWRVTGFISFDQTTGWWGVPGLKEEGWQGPSDSVGVPGLLTLTVQLENQGDGVLEAWCYMPDTPMPGDHQSDGIALTGGQLAFTGYRENELGDQGVMFYSTDPAVDGYVLTPNGTTVYRARSSRMLSPRSEPGQGLGASAFLCHLIARADPGAGVPGRSVAVLP